MDYCEDVNGMSSVGFIPELAHSLTFKFCLLEFYLEFYPHISWAFYHSIKYSIYIVIKNLPVCQFASYFCDKFLLVRRGFLLVRD